MFEVVKGIFMCIIVFIGIRYCWQGWIYSLLWIGLLVWSYIGSVSGKRAKIIENIWFLLFCSLLCLLLCASTKMFKNRIVIDSVFKIFSASESSLFDHYLFVSAVVIFHVAAVFSHRIRILGTLENDTASEKKHDKKIRSLFNEFHTQTVFRSMASRDIKLREEYNISAFSEADRAARFIDHEYILIVKKESSENQDLRGATIICDTSSEDNEYPIVAYSVESITDWEKLREALRKQKTKTKEQRISKSQTGHDRL